MNILIRNYENTCRSKGIVPHVIRKRGKDYVLIACGVGCDDIPDFVTKIGDGAFRRSQMKSIHIPRAVRSIGKEAFYSCRFLTEVHIEDNSTLRTIKSKAFEACFSLRSITLPDGVVNMGSSIFRDCLKLEHIQLPSKLHTIPSYMFYNCKALSDCIIPDTVHTICKGAFGGTGFDAVVIPDSVRSIASKAFVGCAKLRSVRLPEQVKHIDASAFMFCSALQGI